MAVASAKNPNGAELLLRPIQRGWDSYSWLKFVDLPSSLPTRQCLSFVSNTVARNQREAGVKKRKSCRQQRVSRPTGWPRGPADRFRDTQPRHHLTEIPWTVNPVTHTHLLLFCEWNGKAPVCQALLRARMWRCGFLKQEPVGQILAVLQCQANPRLGQSKLFILVPLQKSV